MFVIIDEREVGFPTVVFGLFETIEAARAWLKKEGYVQEVARYSHYSDHHDGKYRYTHNGYRFVSTAFIRKLQEP